MMSEGTKRNVQRKLPTRLQSNGVDSSKHICFVEANKALAADKTEIDFAFVITSNSYYPMIKTIRTDDSRKSVKTVFITYCPFCGEKL